MGVNGSNGHAADNEHGKTPVGMDAKLPSGNGSGAIKATLGANKQLYETLRGVYAALVYIGENFATTYKLEQFERALGGLQAAFDAKFGALENGLPRLIYKGVGDFMKTEGYPTIESFVKDEIRLRTEPLIKRVERAEQAAERLGGMADEIEAKGMAKLKEAARVVLGSEINFRELAKTLGKEIPQLQDLFSEMKQLYTEEVAARQALERRLAVLEDTLGVKGVRAAISGTKAIA